MAGGDVVRGGAKEGEREVGRGEEKKTKEDMIFLPTPHPYFSSLKP